jgi:hypothetical protein
MVLKLLLAAAILSNSCLFGRLRERRAKLKVERANACSSVQGTNVQMQSTNVQVQGTSVQIGGIPVLDISLNWF